MIAAAELVVQTLSGADSHTAPRTTVLAAVAVAERYGRREATAALGMATMSGRVVKVIGADGILCLRLVDHDETEDLKGQMHLPAENARPGGTARFSDTGARGLRLGAAGAQSPIKGTDA